MAKLRIFQDFNQAELQRIAKEADNKQVVQDVGYASFLNFHSPQKMYIERTDKAFILGCYNQKAFRIIGMATVVSERGKGYASFFLNRAIIAAKKRGLKKIETRSRSGVQFYLNKGFEIKGMKGQDFLLEKTI